MGLSEIEKTVKSMTALTHNSREILHKISDWATSNSQYIKFNLIDSNTGGYVRTTVEIPTVHNILTPYWGTPFSANDKRDSFIDNMRFYSYSGGWVFEKQDHIPVNEYDSNYSAISNRFWENKIKPLSAQYYHNDVASYTHVDAIFRNNITRFLNNDTTTRTADGNYIVDDSNIPSSYVDIKSSNAFALKPKYIVFSGTNAGLHFGDTTADTYTRSLIFNREIYLGYSAPFSIGSHINVAGVKTNYLHLEALSAIHIGSNNHHHSSSQTSRKKIYIGNTASPYSNIDISLAGSKLGAYVTDELWLGKWYGTSSSVSSAVNIVGKNIGIANFNNQTNSNIYLNVGHSAIKLHSNVVAYDGTHYYKTNYILSGANISIGSASQFIEIGSYNTGSTYIGHKAGHVAIAHSAGSIEAFNDTYSVDVGSMKADTIPAAPTNADISGWGDMDAAEQAAAWANYIALYNSQLYFNTGLNIGTNRYAINIGTNAKNINVGYGETSSVVRGTSFVASAATTTITSSEDTIIKGGKDIRYGKPLPTIKGGMWNDSEYSLNQYGLEVEYRHKQHSNGLALTDIGHWNTGGLDVINGYDVGSNDPDTVFCFASVKKYIVNLKDKKLIFELVPMDNGLQWTIKLVCISNNSVNILMCSSSDGNDLLSAVDVSNCVRPFSTYNGAADTNNNGGIQIHDYYEPGVTPYSNRPVIGFIDVFESDDGNIIIRKITSNFDEYSTIYDGFSSYIRTQLYNADNIPSYIPQNYRKIAVIGKSIRRNKSNMSLPPGEGMYLNYNNDIILANGIPEQQPNGYHTLYSCDIFGFESWGETIPGPIGGSVSSKIMSSHHSRVLGSDSFNLEAEFKASVSERPHLICFAYNDTKLVTFGCHIPGNDGFFQPCQAKYEVVTTKGYYKTNVLINNRYYTSGVSNLGQYSSSTGTRIITGSRCSITDMSIIDISADGANLYRPSLPGVITNGYMQSQVGKFQQHDIKLDYIANFVIIDGMHINVVPTWNELQYNGVYVRNIDEVQYDTYNVTTDEAFFKSLRLNNGLYMMEINKLYYATSLNLINNGSMTYPIDSLDYVYAMGQLR